MLRRNTTGVYRQVGPAVVHVGFESLGRQGNGSGMLIDRQGHILTNNHVVAGASELTVRLHDGRSYEAQVVGRDPPTDLAVLKLVPSPVEGIDAPPDEITPVRLGDSDTLTI